MSLSIPAKQRTSFRASSSIDSLISYCLFHETQLLTSGLPSSIALWLVAFLPKKLLLTKNGACRLQPKAPSQPPKSLLFLMQYRVQQVLNKISSTKYYRQLRCDRDVAVFSNFPKLFNKWLRFKLHRPGLLLTKVLLGNPQTIVPCFYI
jgi:hypothetical protein